MGLLTLLNALIPDGFMIMPQDCMGIPRDIAGHVLNENGEPVANANILINSNKSKMFKAEEVTMKLNSDEQGNFGKAQIRIFACDALFFEISANGYGTRKFQFRAAQEPQGVAAEDPDGYGDPNAKYNEDNDTSSSILPGNIVVQFKKSSSP